MLTITQNSKMGEGDLDPSKLQAYASIKPGGVMYGKGGSAPMVNGMGATSAQTPFSQAPGTVAPAVQPEQAVFGDPNPPNPAAVSGMAPKGLATGTQPGTVFDANDGLGMDNYDSYINKSFQHAMRTLDPMIQQNEARFDQSMIDKGFAPDSEGFQTSFDNNSRRYNDLIAAAANSAMGFGANRLDSDRQYGLQRDTFDLNELSTFDGMNRAWDDIGYRNAVFNTSREDQQFNQMLSLFGMTPVGTTVPTNTSSNFANSANAQLSALNANNQLYGAVGNSIADGVDALGNVDWGSIFNSWGFGGSGSSSGRGGGF